MAEITAKDVQALRQATGAGILDCRRALQETEGDLEKAKQWLREQGLAGASKRADRERAEGAVSVIVAGDSGLRSARWSRSSARPTSSREGRPGVRRFLVDALADSSSPTDGEDGLAAHDEPEIEGKLKVDSLKENIALGRHERFEASADHPCSTATCTSRTGAA